MDKKFDSFAYVEQVGVDLVNDFEKARRGTTPTLVGSAMEKATRDKLNQLLPRALAAGSGCVIDSEGRTSRQLDVVIYERFLCPVFCINDNPETTYYPCEGVMAVGEIKSTVGKAEFDDAIRKMESVKTLKRSFTHNPSDNENVGIAVRTRKYGQMELDGLALVLQYSDSREGVECDILTYLLTDKCRVGIDTLSEYYKDRTSMFHDILISLEGYAIFGAKMGEDGKFGVTTMRAAEEIRASSIKSPFGYLLGLLYRWFRYGKTAETESFEKYIIRRQ